LDCRFLPLSSQEKRPQSSVMAGLCQRRKLGIAAFLPLGLHYLPAGRI
jgi:hypothetical protein